MFLVGFCVHINPGSQEQLIIGFVFSLVILLFTSIAEPFQCHGHDKFSLLCNFSLVMVFFFSLVLKMGVLSEEVNNLGVASDDFQNKLTFDEVWVSVALISTLLASLIVASVLAVYQVFQSTRSSARAAAAEREVVIARGHLSLPPTTSWELRQGNRFSMFLSHFKEEAGSDARYLSDLIKRMTGCATYLDSNNLVDLRTLFKEGELTNPSHTFLHVRKHAHTQQSIEHARMQAEMVSRCVRGRRSQVGRSRPPRHEERHDAAMVPTGDVGGGSESDSHRALSGGWRRLDSGRCTYAAERPHGADAKP